MSDLAKAQEKFGPQTQEVRFSLAHMGDPNNCLLNVEQMVKEKGGEVVLGWAVKLEPYYWELRHHVVWRTPEGSLLDITPNVLDATAAGYICSTMPTVFFPDSEATFVGEERKVRLNRYLPTFDDPHCQAGCEYLGRSDRAYYSGSVQKGDYWTGRAETELSKCGMGRVEIDRVSPDLLALYPARPDEALQQLD